MKKLKTLKKNYEFKNVLNKGKFYTGKQIIVYINNNKSNENIIGIAVKRNHIKRLIRESYYYIKKEKLEYGHNIVFVWNKKIDIKKANYHIIKKDMENIFKKANLIKKDEEK